MLSYSSAQGAGVAAARLRAAFALVEQWVEKGVVSGAVALVARRGRIAGTAAYGNISSEPGDTSVAVDTPFTVASLTKLVTATAVLTRVDEGQIGLDTPVKEVLTEWDVPGAERITFAHLLSHTSGLPVDLPPGTLAYEDRNPIGVIVDAFMRVPPRYAPGERLIYSNTGYAILGRALERMMGMSYREAVWRCVLGPLWMNDTFFGNPPAAKEGRVAIVEGTDRPGTDLDPYNGSYYRELATPWGGIFSTAPDLAALAQVFLNNGKPLLEVGTALAAIRNWTNGLSGGFTTWRSFPTGDWGLGWEVKGARGRHWSGDRTSHVTFGHVGGSGVMMWADPLRDLVCVAMANRVIGDGWPIEEPQDRWPAFSNAVIEALLE